LNTAYSGLGEKVPETQTDTNLTSQRVLQVIFFAPYVSGNQHRFRPVSYSPATGVMASTGQRLLWLHPFQDNRTVHKQSSKKTAKY